MSHPQLHPCIPKADHSFLLRRKVEEGKEAGRTTNYGCISRMKNEDGTIPWTRVPGGWITPGKCFCDNWVLNELADTVLEAMPMITQVSISLAWVFEVSD